MYIKCNPNPLGKTVGDCVVRALAIATDRSWKNTYRELCDYGEIECDMPSSNPVWGLNLRERGGEMMVLPQSCPACMTVRAFCERFKDGVYVIGTGSHAVTVIDGDWYDAWDSGAETVSFYYKMK